MGEKKRRASILFWLEFEGEGQKGMLLGNWAPLEKGVILKEVSP